ncbi:MAG: hypothetical protein IKA09_02170 [Lachnospiraceae bacterium]|nr:hypothetical protein [Lachnospiraceae bacterium]
MIAAFVIWGVMGLFFIGMGIYDYHAKTAKPFGFWSNVKVAEVKDVKAYNKALGKLFICFGIVFILLGLPLLAGQNSPWIIVSMVGVMVLTIVSMAVYTVGIEGKYRK